MPLLVLLAAVLHAVWNAIAHAIADKLLGFALLGCSYLLCGLVCVFLAPAPGPKSWALLGISSAVHIGYTFLLMYCYRIGEFGQVYPLARGSAPWLVALAAAVFVAERLTGLHLLGLLVISAGLFALVFANGIPGRDQLPAIVAALATGVTIACYSTLDGVGARLSHHVVGYAAWLFLIEGAVDTLAMAVLIRRRTLTRRATHRQLLAGVLGGALSVLAYAIVLWAQTHSTLASVSALRETNVVAGAAIGAWVFHERFGRRRIVATAVVLAGIGLMIS